MKERQRVSKRKRLLQTLPDLSTCQGESSKAQGKQHLYGLRRKKVKALLSETEEQDTATSTLQQVKLSRQGNVGKLEGDAKSHSKKFLRIKSKSSKRRSKYTHRRHTRKKKKSTVTEHEDEDEEEERVHNEMSTDSSNGNFNNHTNQTDMILLNVKEEVIDPEYEHVLMYATCDTEESDYTNLLPNDEASKALFGNRENVSIREETEESSPDEEESESAMVFSSNSEQDNGSRLRNLADGMSLIMEVKEEIEDEGYEVIKEWNENDSDFSQNGNVIGETQLKDASNLVSLEVKGEISDTSYQEESTNDSGSEYPLKLQDPSNLEAFLLHKNIFWVFHCPLCNSQQVFLQKIWLERHLDGASHRNGESVSSEAQALLHKLGRFEENFCPVQTCQVPLGVGPSDFCKHLLLEHIDSFNHIKKLCQINVFCKQNPADDGSIYSLTIQHKGKWHTYYRSKGSVEVETSAAEDSSELFTICSNEDDSKMKMTVRVVGNERPPQVVANHNKQHSYLPALGLVTFKKNNHKFCMNGIYYYKCPICPSPMFFFDVLCLKNHMIKKSHPLSSVCKVLKETGIQHPTHTCPVVDCDEDFGQSQKKQHKHIVTQHPKQYEIMKQLMGDSSYQNLQTLMGIDGCIGGLQTLGMAQPQTINVTYRAPNKLLPTLKPKAITPTSSAYQNTVMATPSQSQQKRTTPNRHLQALTPEAISPSSSAYQNTVMISPSQSQQQTSALIGSLHPVSSASLLQQPALFPSLRSKQQSATLFPSSQTVRQILNSKNQKANKSGAPLQGELPNLNSEAFSLPMMNTCSNGVTTLSWPESGLNHISDHQASVRIHSARSLSKPRPLCYKCGVNALTNIGLISHLFNDHCSLVCKLCSFTAQPLKISDGMLHHLKEIHDISVYELEQNVFQSLPDLPHAIGISQLDGLSCITQKKFIVDELVVHYSLVDATYHHDLFQDDFVMRQVKKIGDEVWVEILVGEKSHKITFSPPVTQASAFEYSNAEDLSQPIIPSNLTRNMLISERPNSMTLNLEESNESNSYITSMSSSTCNPAEQNDGSLPNGTSEASQQVHYKSPSTASATLLTKLKPTFILPKTGLMQVQPAPSINEQNSDVSNQLQNKNIERVGETYIEQESPLSSGYNSPIRKWLFKESSKEIKFKSNAMNLLHCPRCHVSSTTNRGIILHIFACHSINVCKFCFFDLSKACTKKIKWHLSTHSEYNRQQPLEDFLSLSCPELMQLLGIPSLDQLCNITRDRIIFTFRVVWYRMVQVSYYSDCKHIMQRNLMVSQTVKPGSPDIIIFFRNKDGKVISIEEEISLEVASSSTPFRPERSSQFPYYVGQKVNLANVPVAELEVKEHSPVIPPTNTIISESFVEGKDFTIVLQGNDRIFKCLKCTRAYWKKCKMRRHLKVHLNIRNYQCHLCQKSFHYNYHLKAHMNIHNNSRPYKCTKCSKSYNNSGSLSWHVRQCHGMCNFSKNKVLKVQCQVCFIQIRQELYHEHLRDRHGVAVAYQYKKQNDEDDANSEATDTIPVILLNDESQQGVDVEKSDEINSSQLDFPWRGELIVDEGDEEDEHDSHDLAPTTAQDVVAVDDNSKEETQLQKYTSQEVYQCTFCHVLYNNLPAFSSHTCLERPNKAKLLRLLTLQARKKSLQNYAETYTCSKCRKTSSILGSFVALSHPCTAKSVGNFTCEKTYTCKLCQYIFVSVEGLHKHVCENADQQMETEEEVSPETLEQESATELPATISCPVCSEVYTSEALPHHLLSKHHLNKKVVFELMQQNVVGKS